MAKIIYVSTRQQTPVGGIKILFRHVELLRKNGFDAYILHPVSNFRPQWLKTDVPMLYFDNQIPVDRNDVFVIPETGQNTIRHLSKITARKMVFCQNQYGIFQGLADAKNYEQLGASLVFACSQIVADSLKLCFSYSEVPVIPCSVDSDRFKPLDKTPSIAVMPRKRPNEYALIRRIFLTVFPDFAHIPWRVLDNCSENDVANALGQSTVFLSLSSFEGLGLPPLEAMAADCLVVGFHGIGGREYATDHNGIWIEAEDLFHCANMLGQALRWSIDRDDKAESMIRAGRDTVANYTPENMENKLLDFWRTHLPLGADQ